MKIRYNLLAIVLIIFVVSCNDDNGSGPETQLPDQSTVYVTNEGNFNDSDGSITSFDPEKQTKIQKAFEKKNGRPLAGLAQTSAIVGDQMFIVLNQADKIEVASANSLESIGTIPVSISPTALEVVDQQTAFVTTLDYQSAVDSVLVIDLSTMEQTDRRIAVGNAPRGIVRVGNRVYVSNAGGNTISVINPATESVVQTITVGTTPSQMIVDSEKRIWVVCNGRQSYDESKKDKPGSIYVLDGTNGDIIGSLESPEILPKADYIYRLAINESQGTAYFLNKGIDAIDMNNIAFSDTTFINRSFYSIGYSSKQEKLYLGQSRGYDQDGQALIYSLQGTAVDSFSAGIAPNRFYFFENK